MATLRRLWQRLRHAASPGGAEVDIQRELAAHRLMLEDEFRQRGKSDAEARMMAARRLGGLEQIKVHHRETRSIRVLDELRIDVTFAWRRLRAWPGVPALAIAMLATAVGLSTASFTVVDGLFLRPLPFPHADRLASVWMRTKTGGRRTVSAAVVRAWRASTAFDNVEGAESGPSVIDTASGPLARRGANVTPGLFDMLGARPIAGRLFAPDAAGRQEVVISEELWRAAFGADRSILGRAVRFDDTGMTVVGIMPATFHFPAWDTSFWSSVDLNAPDAARMVAYVKRAPHVPESDALRVAADVAHTIDPSTAAEYATRSPIIGGYFDKYRRQAVPILAGAVVLVGSALSANVVCLLLTRLRARRREFAMCVALGASRGRLIRQAVVEGALVGLGGVVGGIALAWGLVSLAAAFLPREFIENSLNPLDLDLRALVAAVLAGLFATICAALAPAWLATRVDGKSNARASERQGTHTTGERLAVRALLVLQVSLSCALLIGAMLLVRSFVNVSRLDRGFDPGGLVELTWSFDGTTVTTREARTVVAARLREEVLSLPGVREATWSRSAGIVFGDIKSDLPAVPPVATPVQVTAIEPTYFDVYRSTLVIGRSFRADDGPDAAIVGESLAAKLWPDAQALGRAIIWSNRILRVVGIVREPRQSLVDADRENLDLFTPLDGPGRYPVLTARCGNACPSEGTFRRGLHGGAQGGLVDARYLEAEFARDLEQPRASASLAATFAAIALAATAFGLFGSLAYSVQERRREFGVRAALGATPSAIAGVVYREAAILTGVGLAGGTIVAAFIARSLKTIIFGIQPFDPATWSAVVGTLVLTIALATWRPARLAARTDPAMQLREDG
ncbi:MAG: ABC transporter permease [Vicinamibacterales bacterium]